MSSQKDKIFADKMLPGDFVFDEKVTAVFDDMINRSVPGYNTIIAMIGVLAERYYQPGSRIYDLGCSLGGATFSMASQAAVEDSSIVAIDNSKAMVEKLQLRLADNPTLASRVECRCEDVLLSELHNASVVVLNFTLQFIPVAERVALLQRIYDGMQTGGILIISEKIVFPDKHLNQLFIDMYHSFKETMGYSRLEISQKRAALENVLIPESIATHRKRLTDIGFHSFDSWFQCFNFASMVAFK